MESPTKSILQVFFLQVFMGLLVFCLPFASLLADDNTVTREKILSHLKLTAAPFIEDGSLVGLSMGLVHRGERFVVGLGTTQRGQSSVPDENTLYEIGSITKVFTGLLFADAIVSRKLAIEDCLEVVDSELVIRERDSKSPAIALLDLATHTSGLPRMPNNWVAQREEDPYRHYDRKLLVDELKHTQTDLKSHRPQSYSNLGAGLLGEAICQKSNMPYEGLLQTRILKPMQMPITTTLHPSVVPLSLATPYREDLSETSYWHFDALVGAGGVISSINDLLNFVECHLEPQEPSLQEAIDLAWQPHYTAASTDESSMGLGWHIAADHETHWHNGQTGGFHSMLLIHRKKGTAVVVLSNTASRKVDTLAQSLFEYFTQ